MFGGGFLGLKKPERLQVLAKTELGHPSYDIYFLVNILN